MLIIAGHLTVASADRDRYVADCRGVVQQARHAPGCLDFALTVDTLDSSRVNVYERWEDEASLDAFRGTGPDQETSAQIQEADVRRFTISSEGSP